MDEYYFSYLQPNMKWVKDNTIYLTKHGSHCYGTNRPDSDLDLRGICIPPKRYILGVLDNFEQSISNHPVDITVFGLSKFITLAINNNPNALEIIFTDPSDQIFINDIGRSLLDIRDSFLSKKSRFTLAGYAHSQLKRIHTHRRWLLKPVTTKPERKDYGLPETHKLIPEHQLLEIEAAIRKVLDSWQPDTTGMENDVAIKFKNELYDILLELKINHDDMDLYAARYLGLNDNLIESFKKERQYKLALRDWKNYKEWEQSRNESRAELEKKFGYDCFTDDTEFLTENGFKKFDDIKEADKLATVFLSPTGKNLTERKHFGIEYQNFTEKFDGTFNGNLYNFYGNHLDVLVTPNHRMLYREISRNLIKEHDWKLDIASTVPDCFDFLRTINPNTKNYSNKEIFKDLPFKPYEYMKLMGAFLSDGSFSFNKNEPDAITISQKEDNRLHKWMKNFYQKYKNSLQVSLYEYYREPNEFRTESMKEIVLSIRNKALVNKLYNDCGHSKDKHIPRYVFDLSKQLKEYLFDYMVKGDGTVRNTTLKSIIYYSSVKQLADDIQELSFLSGWETSLYGPYEYEKNGKLSIMYQVHINKHVKNYDRLVRYANLKKIPVTNQRIVCFSVPNSTLIIRRKGHVSIQGNCKHGMHLVRLYRQCIELLRDGKLNVKRHDAQELLEIRNGAWTYEQLIEWAESQDKIIDELYKTSTLPKEPNRVKINNWLINTLDSCFQSE